MAKRRLLTWMRDKLKVHAEKVIEPHAERKVLDATYRKAEPLVRKAVAAKFPPADMAICKKYSVADVDDCIKLSFPNAVVQVFDFAKGTGPLVTSTTYHGQIYLANEKTAAAVEAWVTARDAYKSERAKRLTAYRALIDGSGYIEDIAAVWPEAGELLPKEALPIPLGPEQIAIIEADAAERKKFSH